MVIYNIRHGKVVKQVKLLHYITLVYSACFDLIIYLFIHITYILCLSLFQLIDSEEVYVLVVTNDHSWCLLYSSPHYITVVTVALDLQPLITSTHSEKLSSSRSAVKLSNLFESMAAGSNFRPPKHGDSENETITS